MVVKETKTCDCGPWCVGRQGLLINLLLIIFMIAFIRTVIFYEVDLIKM